jgi:hypothetical protein
MIRSFSWAKVRPTESPEDTQTSAGGAVEKLYTVPSDKIWRLCSWRVWPSTASKLLTIRLYKEAAKTNLIEEWLYVSSAYTPYSSRGLNAAAYDGWFDEDLAPGTTIAFNYASNGADQTMKTQVVYKERDLNS